MHKFDPQISTGSRSYFELNNAAAPSAPPMFPGSSDEYGSMGSSPAIAHATVSVEVISLSAADATALGQFVQAKNTDRLRLLLSRNHQPLHAASGDNLLLNALNAHQVPLKRIPWLLEQLDASLRDIFVTRPGDDGQLPIEHALASLDLVSTKALLPLTMAALERDGASGYEKCQRIIRRFVELPDSVAAHAFKAAVLGEAIRNRNEPNNILALFGQDGSTANRALREFSYERDSGKNALHLLVDRHPRLANNIISALPVPLVRHFIYNSPNAESLRLYVKQHHYEAVLPALKPEDTRTERSFPRATVQQTRPGAFATFCTRTGKFFNNLWRFGIKPVGQLLIGLVAGVLGLGLGVVGLALWAVCLPFACIGCCCSDAYCPDSLSEANGIPYLVIFFALPIFLLGRR